MIKIKRFKAGVSRSRAGNMVIFVILLSFAAFMLLPFVYAIAQSLKPIDEIFAYPPKFFAKKPTFDNYKELSQITDSLWIPFSRYLFNSIVVSVIGTGLNVIISSMAAFPLAKYDFPGAKGYFRTVTAALLFAGPVTALPQYIIMSKLNLINSIWSVIFPAVAAPMGLFLMKNFMQQINSAMIEAATIDGAGIFKVFIKIIMPNVRPAVFTLLILSFQSLWNSTGGSYIYDEKLKLLPTILSQIATSGIARTGSASAASVLMMIPPTVLFILLQSRVVETMANSGIKG